MIEVPIYSQKGQQVGSYSVDEALLGSTVRPALLKQAVVMYHANRRQGTVQTKGRGDVAGSTRKLYAQKKTGNARRGNIRTNVMKGGGMAFAKRPRDFRQDMPLRQRRLARNNAILAKIQSSRFKLLDNLTLGAPKTRDMAAVLKALELTRSVLIATDTADRNLYLSTRNLPRTRLLPAAEINAFDILNSQALVMTRAALDGLLQRVQARATTTEKAGSPAAAADSQEA